MSDPRMGLTSASNAAADEKCSGRHLAQRGIPEPPESKDAASGSLVHQAFSNPDSCDLNRQQRKTFKRGKYIEAEVVRRFFNEPLEDEEIDQMAHREERLWAKVAGVGVHSGQIDAFWISRDWKSILIEDIKSLFGDHDDATENQQLRDYAALVWENYGVETVKVFINQPATRWALEDQLVVTYSAEDLQQAHALMMKRVDASNSITSARTPGLEQCRFCRAAGTIRCPESSNALVSPGQLNAADFKALTPANRGIFVSELSRIGGIVKKLTDEIKQAIKEDPSFVEGWKVSEGAMMRSFSDNGAIFGLVRDYIGEGEFDAADFLAKTAKFSVPELTDWFVAKIGGVESEAYQTFSLLFDGLIVKKQKEGSLTKVKK